MASGSILGNVDGNLQAKVEWSSTSNGSQANTSTVRATVYARRTNTATTSGRSWSGYVSIGGEQEEISFSSSVSISSNWVEMASKERVVSHNSDGTKQIAIEGEVTGPSGTSLAGRTSYAHQDVWLDKIPRYATGVSISLVSKTLTSATFNWSANETCSAIKYGINQSSLTEINVNAKSGSFTITGLAANTTYTVYFNAKRSDSNLYLESNKTASVTTYDKAHIIGYSTQFNIGSNVSITYDNPGKSSKVKFKVYTYSPVQSVYTSDYLSTNGGTFTWTNTSVVYEKTPNNNSIKLYFNLVTETDMGEYTDSYVVTANVTNSNPTFSNFTYEDTNGTTKALTGSTVNNPILVNGYSNVTATISTANKANPKNSAKMTSYTMSIGSQTSDPVSYSDSSQVQLSLPKVNSGIVIISAKDSRGNSTTVQKGNNSSLFKNYTDLVIKSVTATRSDNGVGKVVTLSYNGTFWNASFGSTTNTIKTLKYYYKLTTASSWTTGGTTLTKTVSGNNWSGSININGDLGTEGFNISNAYNIRLEVSDELSTKTFDLTLTSGTPAMSIYKNSVAIGKQYDTSQGGVLQIGGKVGGDIYFNNNSSSIIWKENGYGDKFRIVPDFNGADDDNKLKIQGTVGGAGTDPTSYKDLMTISGKSGNVSVAGSLSVSGNVSVNGQGVLPYGTRGTQLSSGGGTSGYMYVCDLETTTTYQNQVIKFDVLQRGRYGTLWICTSGNGTAGTLSVSYIRKDGNINAYYKTANNVVSIYLQKTEAYDSIEICGIEKGSYMAGTSITWKNQTVTSLPSGYVTVMNFVADMIYPVGAIYISVNSTSPASLFGGTWEQLKDRFLIGAGNSYAINSTGGATTHTHGAGSLYAQIKNYGGGIRLHGISENPSWTDTAKTYDVKESSSSELMIGGTTVAGTSGSGSTMPPYLAVYMWKRTA